MNALQAGVSEQNHKGRNSLAKFKCGDFGLGKLAVETKLMNHLVLRQPTRFANGQKLLGQVLGTFDRRSPHLGIPPCIGKSRPACVSPKII